MLTKTSSLRVWNVAETMDFAHSLYFNAHPWGDDIYECNILSAAGNIIYVFKAQSLIDPSAPKRAVVRHGSRTVAKRLIELLCKETYSREDLEKFHMMLAETMGAFVATDFIAEGGHLALVERCWSISRVPRTMHDLTVRPYISFLYV